MEIQVAAVGRRAPDFDLPCTQLPGSTQRRAALSDYGDRWLILAFYPRDFSLVCPTELTALSNRYDEFRGRSCEIIGISSDSVETHERWTGTPETQGRIGPLRFPLASDEDGSVSRAYGVYLDVQHIALRGLFIIDPNGVLQYQAVHNQSVGRRSDEVISVLAALESGGMCPEDWCVDCPTLDATTELAPGRVLSHYRIEAELGRGSFGCVYRAHDTTLDRTVALKVFQSEKLSNSSAVLDEARSAAAVNHPNVCTIFAVDDSEGIPFISMEYVDGHTLSTLLDNSPIPLPRVQTLGYQIALGLATAHSQGIVHGDLKPSNIMLTHNDVVKITDFGLARRYEHFNANEETADWVSEDDFRIAGTPGYMSPERTRGGTITPAGDVFSTGAVLYEMLSGQKAFGGSHVFEVFDEISNVDPDRFAAEVPDPFADILRRALIADPEQRDITMQEIVDILHEPNVVDAH